MKNLVVLLAASAFSLQPMAGAKGITLADCLKDTPAPVTKTYKTVNSVPLTLDIFSPADLKPGDKRMAMVLIHGGAWVAGDSKVFYPHARYFASRGAVAISINYRLLTATGPSLGDCLADCKSAIRYIRAHATELGIDPDHVAVLGDSAGGHLAAALGTVAGFDDPQDDLKISAVPNAMVLCNPIVDMTEGTWIKFVIRGAALDKKPAPEACVPTPDQLKLGRELSPLFQIKPGQPPALLMHGLDDHIVTPDQARQFAKADVEAKNRCDLVLIEGARHAFVLPKYTAPEPMVLDAIRKADQFLVSLGFLIGAPTLELSSPPAWVTPAPKH